MSDEQTETTTEQAEKKFRLQTIISDTDVVTLRKVSDPVALALGDNSGQAYPDRDTQELIEALKEYVVEIRAAKKSTTFNNPLKSKPKKPKKQARK